MQLRLERIVSYIVRRFCASSIIDELELFDVTSRLLRLKFLIYFDKMDATTK